MNQILVEIDAPMDDTSSAIVLIERTLEKNNIKSKLSIAYDFDLDACGCYYPKEKSQANRIFVNPSNCKTQEDIHAQNWIEPFCPGSPCDMTLFSVTIHEFCHFLQYKVYPTIIKDFSKEFPTTRFYLNQYCNNEIKDELAEIMTLYLTNPYLLRLISKPHFNFCKKYLKSPVECSLKRCVTIYNGFPIPVKEHLEKHWKIVFDADKQKFVKVEN